jgi:hypothetical protein
MKKLIIALFFMSCNTNKGEFTILHYKYVNTFTQSTLYDDSPMTTNYQCVFVGTDGVSYEVDTLQFPKFKEGDTLYIKDLLKMRMK